MTTQWTVYRITNTANGKMYVGITIRTIKARWQAHIYESRRATPDILRRRFLLAAIRKYGPTSFKMDVLTTCDTREDAINAEIRFVAQYDCFGLNGYNATTGGDGINPMSPKAREIFEQRNNTPEAKEWARQLAAKMNSDTEWGRKRRQATIARNKRPEIRQANSVTARAWHSDPANLKFLSDLALERYKDPSEREKLSEALTLAHAANPTHRAAISANRSGTISITNEIESRWIKAGSLIPNGWRRGRPKRKLK